MLQRKKIDFENIWRNADCRERERERVFTTETMKKERYSSDLWIKRDV